MRQLTDGDGDVTLAQGYTPFGVLLWSEGSGASGYGFTGEQQDPSAGLVFLRARYYDPATGQFISKDTHPGVATMPATLHPYLYSLNNPVNHTDPSGEFAFIPLLLVAAAGGLLGGLGYYTVETYILNPCDEPRWNWGEAFFWGGVGTGLGALIGTGIYTSGSLGS